MTKAPASHVAIRSLCVAMLTASAVIAGKPLHVAVTSPPEALRQSLGLSPFYKKYVNAGGLPVVASARVSDYALLEAAYIIDHMLEGRKNLRRALAASPVKLRVAVMSPTELTTDIPEHADLTPKPFWDKRARGLGATTVRPAVSCAEENLLGYRGDPYATESILVHEFGHVVHEWGMNALDATFDTRLEETYQRAIKAGLWAGTYAATNHSEYWAEGVQSWFDTNRTNDAEHNNVHTRAQLKEYDAGLSSLLVEAFGDRAWRYVEPGKRKVRAHLAGFDPTKAPTFTWPAELLAWSQAHPDGEADGRTADVLSLLPPETAPVPVSGTGSVKTSITFVNHTVGDVSILWNDWRGEPKSYGRIRPGESGVYQTYSGHVWIVADPSGKTLAIVVAADKPGRALIEPIPNPK